MFVAISSPPSILKPTGNLHLGTHQDNLVDSAQTLVELDTITPNFPDGIEDTVLHKITPAVAGFYDVKAQIGFYDIVVDKVFGMYVYKNNSDTLIQKFVHTSFNYDLYIGGSVLVYLNNTDYVTLKAYHSSGVDTICLRAGAADTFLSVALRRKA